jgi:WD40 repeat protein
MDPVDRPKRRFQFGVSLRVWLVLIAVLGTSLGLFYRRTRITPQAMAELQTVARVTVPDVFHLAWSPDRSRIGLILWEKPVEIRDSVSLGLRETFGQGKKLITFCISPDPNIVAYGENNKNVYVEDLTTHKFFTLKTKNSQPSIAFSPDGKLIATGGYGTEVMLWDVSHGRQIGTFQHPGTEGALTPVFSPDGKRLAVGNRNNVTALFDVSSCQLIRTWPHQSTQELQFDPTGKVLAVTYVNGQLRLWNVADGRLLREVKSGAEELYSVDWSPDGRMLATSGSHGPITLWDASDLKVVKEIQGRPWVSQVRFSPDGFNLIFMGGEGDTSKNARNYLEVLGIEGPLFRLFHRPTK